MAEKRKKKRKIITSKKKENMLIQVILRLQIVVHVSCLLAIVPKSIFPMY